MLQLRRALTITCRLTDRIANDHHERNKDTDAGDQRCQVRMNVTRWRVRHVEIDVDDRLFVFKPMCSNLLIRESCELAKQMRCNDECMDSIVGVK